MQQVSKDRGKTGLTLIDVIAAFSIFFIILAAALGVLTMGRESWQSGSVQIQVQRDARRGMDTMVRELRQSGSSTIEVVLPDGSPYDNITFRIPEDIDNDGDVIDNNGLLEWGNSISYFIDTNDVNSDGITSQLLRSAGGQSRVLANNITNLQFRRGLTTPNIIEIALQAQKSIVPGRSLQATLNSQVSLRN